MSTQQIRVLITDDHKIIMDGIQLMMNDWEKGICVGTADNGLEALNFLRDGNKVDIVLLDIDMPVMDGIKCCTQIKKDFPEIRVVALTMMSQPSAIKSMLKAGADGYLLKNTGKGELIDCLESVFAGKTYYNQEISQILIMDMSGKTPAKTATMPQLSRRELEILKLISAEMTTSEIAEQLFISFGTVETHRRNIMNKLGARNTAGMMRIAIESGLLKSGD